MKQFKYQINPARVSEKRTVCEVHRELSRLLTSVEDYPGNPVQTLEQAQDLIAEAYDMAKRMSKKLEEHSTKRGADFALEFMDD